MIDVKIEGLDDVVEAIRKIPTSIGRSTVFADAAEMFADRLRDGTPDGYSGKLKDSVLTSESSAGYEDGVESAGNPAFDSVMAARGVSSGRSVLARRALPQARRVRRKWVKTSELESVLESTYSQNVDEIVSYIEATIAEEIDNVGS